MVKSFQISGDSRKADIDHHSAKQDHVIHVKGPRTMAKGRPNVKQVEWILKAGKWGRHTIYQVFNENKVAKHKHSVVFYDGDYEVFRKFMIETIAYMDKRLGRARQEEKEDE